MQYKLSKRLAHPGLDGSPNISAIICTNCNEVTSNLMNVEYIKMIIETRRYCMIIATTKSYLSIVSNIKEELEYKHKNIVRNMNMRVT